jgi:hypothetical protein
MLRFKTLLILTFSLIILFPTIVESQQRNKLEGEVLDKENNPIPGVLVRIYRNHQKVGEDRSNHEGKYLIIYFSGSPITTIRYDHTDWNPATINEISGVRDHNINKVMNKVGSTLDFEEALDLIGTLERIYYIDRANDVQVDELREKYGSVIDKTHIPNVLQQKLMEIRGMYGLIKGLR